MYYLLVLYNALRRALPISTMYYKFGFPNFLHKLLKQPLILARGSQIAIASLISNFNTILATCRPL